MIQSGTLAHEAYLKLVRVWGIQRKNRGHFFALCAQMIRRILMDDARSQRSARRGGGPATCSFGRGAAGTRARGVEIEALDDALTALAKIDPRRARVVEL